MGVYYSLLLMLWQGGKDGKAVEKRQVWFEIRYASDNSLKVCMLMMLASRVYYIIYGNERIYIYIYSKEWYLGAT